MFTALAVRTYLLVAGLRDRAAQLRTRPDAGYNTEATVVIALLAAAAIVIIGIIIQKVTDRANSINLGP
jgi:hypothetical protein